jgi:fructan beta-fructosidase
VEYGANCYAVQTFSDIPAKDGRRIQIAWMNGGKYPGMPFNQQMSVPCELTLRRTVDGLRLFKEPIKEVEKLRARKDYMIESALLQVQDVAQGLTLGDAYDLHAEIETAEAREVHFLVFGQPVVYSMIDKKLTALGRSATLEPYDGKVKLHILADRTSLEVFGNDGKIALTSCMLADSKSRPLSISVTGKTGKVKLAGYPLKAIWPKPFSLLGASGISGTAGTNGGGD